MEATRLPALRRDVGALVAFARSSPSAALFVLGLSSSVSSALLGTSMLSPGHLAGSVLACAGLFGLALQNRVSELTWRPSRGVFWALLVWVGLGTPLLVWAHYWAGVYAMFDVGVFGDLLSGLALRGSYESAPLGVHGLSDHFTPSLMLLGPLFLLSPNFLWLIGAKYVAAFASAILLYFVSREVLGERSRWLWALPTLCLVHTIYGYSNLFQFQPNQLAAPLTLLGFLLALRERWGWLSLCLLVLYGLKEDQPLAGVCIGLFLILERKRPRVGAAVALTAVVVGLMIFFVLMPAFSDGRPLLQHSRFAPLALLPKKALLIVVLYASVGALPLFYPRSLLWSLPALGAHLLSGFPSMISFRYHYQAVPAVVVMVAALYGLRAIENETGVWKALGSRARAFAGAGAIGLVLSLNGMVPQYSARLLWPTRTTRAVVRELGTLRPLLPADRVVYGPGSLLVHLLPHAPLRTVSTRPNGMRRLLEEQRPHVVVLATAPLRLLDHARTQDLLAQMEEVRKARGYRVETPTEHLRVYWSPVAGP